MPYRALKYSKKNRIVFMTLPHTRGEGIVSPRVAQEITDACCRIAQDEDVYVVVITGEGTIFCNGGEWDTERSPVIAIAKLEQPVIAAINGDALGAGLEMALACDVRLASTRARFGMPEVTQGRLTANGGTQRLSRLVGKSTALELLLTGRTITAQEASRIGLVNRVASARRLAQEAEVLALSLAAKAPLALRYIKETVRDGMEMPLAQGLRLEADLYFLLHTTFDRTEGIKAFLEKREPHFKGK
ncbi:MAG: enoyl-CoA hydratase-related protein [Dehalococcoidales bacterium]|nr:enoyl-CoA hydratase-related protein [Dehalococcoidales bacterium]